MRKYQQNRDLARGMSNGLCALLAFAVVGTIVVSAVALAGVAVGCGYSYLTATTNIKMPPEHWRSMFVHRLYEAGGLTALLVVGMAIYKSYQLAEGGGDWLARSLGGTRVFGGTTDASHQRLLNVVEELSIATGLPIPHVYVLSDEPGINAFAAGWDEKDAVIGVTQGALQQLKRHQLQGIVAHEFSHIANGDMRLNVRLLGVLGGVQAISFVSGYLIRLGTTLSSSSQNQSKRGKNPLGMLLSAAFGIAIWPIGQIGSLFALVIKSAVNRQREFLADASAVQYTRDPQGLCEALQTLVSHDRNSRLRGPSAQLASHMFFAGDGSALQRLFRTHPDLEERIRRLDPAVASANTSVPLAITLPEDSRRTPDGDMNTTGDEGFALVGSTTSADQVPHE